MRNRVERALRVGDHVVAWIVRLCLCFLVILVLIVMFQIVALGWHF